jgi:hypothetical protein
VQLTLTMNLVPQKIDARVVTQLLPPGILRVGDIPVVELIENPSEVIQKQEGLLPLDAGANFLNLYLPIIEHL